MIAERKAIHKIGVIITLILFFIAAMCCFTVEKNTSMGIKIISSEEYSGYTEEQKSDLDVTLLFNDLPAAVDTGTKTVYISQQIDEKTGLNNLKGSLKTDNPNFSVFWSMTAERKAWLKLLRQLRDTNCLLLLPTECMMNTI